MHANALLTHFTFFIAQKEDIVSIEIKRNQSKIHNKWHIATICFDMTKQYCCFYGHAIGKKISK